METKGKKIILGSNSPRRRELLGGLDVDFTVDTGNTFTEEYDPETPHERIPEVLSEGKSFGFHRELADDEILITSDTLVLCDGRVMGKPHSYEEAFEMLEGIVNQYLVKHKPQNSATTMEMWRLREQAKQMAEEVVLNDIVRQYH